VQTILAVGEDFELLKTRAEVLRETGATVFCSNSRAALKFIDEWEFDLIVLCHSLRESDAAMITEAAHRGGSKTLVLLVISDSLDDRRWAELNSDAESLVEPGCLVGSANKLLKRQVKASVPEVAGTEPANRGRGRKRPQSFPAETAARKAYSARFGRLRAG